MRGRDTNARHSSNEFVSLPVAAFSIVSNSNAVSGEHRVLRQIDFLALPDGRLVEAVEDPSDPKRTRLAIFRKGRVRFVEEFEYQGRMFMAIPRTVPGFALVPLPKGVLPYGSVKDLYFTISSFLLQAIDVPAQDAMILAAFVLYSWVADRLPAAVYLAIVGLPQSGKSTLLELLRLICRWPLLVSDVSEAALSHACSRFKPTLLIDEIDWSSSNTARTLRRQLRAGTGASSTTLRRNESTLSFGPKVICSLEPTPDAALRSRCIQIIMSETKRANLIRPSDRRMLAFAAELQQKLLRFRFNSYNKVRLGRVPGDQELRPRSRDILACLAAPVGQKFKDLRIALLEYLKFHHDQESRDGLEVRQDAVLALLFGVMHHNPELPYIRVKEVAAATNSLLRADKSAISDKAAGSILAGMGLRNTKRTNRGWILFLNSETRERIHQLRETHGISHLTQADIDRFTRDCPECRKGT
jgi:hypothetical protein